MERTNFAGLTALVPGDALETDGASFINRNPNVIDYLLEIGAVRHRHNAHPALADPSPDPQLSIVASGGALPPDITLWVGYTLVDSYGGETAVSPIASAVTPGSVGDPEGEPVAIVDLTAGQLPGGTYYYAVTFTDGLGGETLIGPYDEAVVPFGSPSAQVILSGLDTLLAEQPDATAYRIYRSFNGGSWAFLAQSAAATFTDDCSICADETIGPPEGNNSLGDSSLVIVVPSAALASASSFNVYCSEIEDLTSPALVGNFPLSSGGVGILVTATGFDEGTPPPVSLSKPGADKIDPDTDMLDWHWLRPVAASALLASGLPGDARVVLDEAQIYVVGSAGASAATDWHVSRGLRGADGASGASGAPGAPGASGAPGPSGAPGAQGPPGSAFVVVGDGTTNVVSPSAIIFHGAATVAEATGSAIVTVTGGGGVTGVGSGMASGYASAASAGGPLWLDDFRQGFLSQGWVLASGGTGPNDFLYTSSGLLGANTGFKSYLALKAGLALVDAAVEIKYHHKVIGAGSFVGVALAAIDADNVLFAGISPLSRDFGIYKLERGTPGSATLAQSAAVEASYANADTDRWIRASIDGDLLTVSLYDTDPLKAQQNPGELRGGAQGSAAFFRTSGLESGTRPIATVVYRLSDAELAKWGPQSRMAANHGVYWIPPLGLPTWYIDEARFYALGGGGGAPVVAAGQQGASGRNGSDGAQGIPGVPGSVTVVADQLGHVDVGASAIVFASGMTVVASGGSAVVGLPSGLGGGTASGVAIVGDWTEVTYVPDNGGVAPNIYWQHNGGTAQNVGARGVIGEGQLRGVVKRVASAGTLFGEGANLFVLPSDLWPAKVANVQAQLWDAQVGGAFRFMPVDLAIGVDGVVGINHLLASGVNPIAGRAGSLVVLDGVRWDLATGSASLGALTGPAGPSGPAGPAGVGPAGPPGPGASGTSRSTTSAVSPVLGSGASAQVFLPIYAKSWNGLRIDTDRPVRVRLYATAAERNADAGRLAATAPTAGTGVILEAITTAARLGWNLVPMVVGANMENPPASGIAMSVTNLGASAASATVALTFIATEI